MDTTIEWNPWTRPLLAGDAKYYLLWGGRQAGRSLAVARKLVQDATTQRLRVACIRWTKEATGASQRADIIEAINDHGFQGAWSINQTGDLRCKASGSVILFRGLQYQNGLRSLTSIDRWWLEEAQYFQDPDFGQMMDTLIRKPGHRGYITGNVRFANDPAYVWSEDMRESNGVAWLPANYLDNRFLSDEAMARAKQVERTDPDVYEHEWLGKVRRTSAEQTVLSAAWVESAIRLYKDHAKMLRGYEHQRDFGLDPSDGGDRMVFGARSGPFKEHVEDVTQKRGMADLGLERVGEVMGGHGARALYYDDGSSVGSQVTNHFAGQKFPWKIVAVPFGGDALGGDTMFGSLTNRQKFPHRNVQMAWNLRLRFEATWLLEQGQDVPLDGCAFVDPTCVNGQYGAPRERDFIDQMVQCEWRTVEGRRIRIDKAPRGLPSPDIFDEYCLSHHADCVGGLRMVR